MYSECKAYLLEKVVQAGVRTKPLTTNKALERSLESHVAAVLFESEALSRNGSKTRYSDQGGAQHKRRKVFDRGLTFTVIIGDYTDDKVEELYEAFLTSLDSGIEVGGNYVPLEATETIWVDKDDSPLKAQVAVQVKVIFYGGIYKDTDFAKLTELEVESVTRTERSQL